MIFELRHTRHPRVQAHDLPSRRGIELLVFLGVFVRFHTLGRRRKRALPPSRPHPHALSSSMSVASFGTECVPARNPRAGVVRDSVDSFQSTAKRAPFLDELTPAPSRPPPQGDPPDREAALPAR